MIDWGKSEKVKTNEDIEKQVAETEAKAYLRDTDWYVMRLVETQKPIPEEIAVKRADARTKISLVQN